ncbi:MAG TPA: hypothetical protein DIT04_13630, partial [Dysgonomonas sp.]|nr:hypothetical protein [Dysgonomonas sp.]
FLPFFPIITKDENFDPAWGYGSFIEQSLYEGGDVQNYECLVYNDLVIDEINHYKALNGDLLKFVEGNFTLSELLEYQRDDLTNTEITRLDEISEYRRTKNVCRMLIEENPENLLYTPERHISNNLLIDMVRKNGNSLGYIEEKFLNYDLCFNAVKNAKDIDSVILFVPKKFMDKQLSEEAVNKGYSAYFLIPERYKSIEISKKAFFDSLNDDRHPKAKYEIISHIPHSEVCFEALKQFKNQDEIGKAYSKIRNELLIEDINNYFVKTNPGYISLVPENLRNQRLIISTLYHSSSPNFINYIPYDEFSDKVVEGIAIKFPRNITDVPVEKVNAVNWLHAVFNFPELAKNVPDDIRKGDNIYKFFNKIQSEFNIPKDWTSFTIQNLYKGEIIKVKELELKDKRNLKDHKIQFDRENGNLKIEPVRFKIKPNLPINHKKKVNQSY